MNKVWNPALGERLSLGAEEMLRTHLTNLWRQKRLILTMVALALVLGILAARLLPKHYTAEAYVRGGFTDAISASQSKNNVGPVVSLDASLLVAARARLFQSHQLARRVVDRLGYDELRSELDSDPISSPLRSALGLIFSGPDVTNPSYRYDVAAAKLLSRLSVKTEQRGYLITVRYTATSPELAALITNAFVAEFVQVTTLQTLLEQRAGAQSSLSEQIAIFGEKHPNVKEGQAKLANLDAIIEAQKRKTPVEIERTAKDSVTLAQPIAVPSSLNPLVWIGMALLFGLTAGIGLASLRLRPGKTAARNQKAA
jgi:uncharacterized protein involved in exopolysaccharide biosynthesis